MWNLFTASSLQFCIDTTIASLEANQNWRKQRVFLKILNLKVPGIWKFLDSCDSCRSSACRSSRATSAPVSDNALQTLASKTSSHILTGSGFTSIVSLLLVNFALTSLVISLSWYRSAPELAVLWSCVHWLQAKNMIEVYKYSYQLKVWIDVLKLLETMLTQQYSHGDEHKERASSFERNS